MDALYLGLFVSALLAATVLPGASEILMLGLLAQGLDIWDAVAGGHDRQCRRVDPELVDGALRPTVRRSALVPGR